MLVFGSFFTAKAQIGGENVYEFLDLSTSARVTALGGLQIATMDDDVSLAGQNPSLYNPEMDTHLSLNTVAFVAGINHGYLGFAKNIDSLATFGMGIQYISYGDLIAADETGLGDGEFQRKRICLQHWRRKTIWQIFVWNEPKSDFLQFGNI